MRRTPTLLWAGAGGLSVLNYRDGRKIVEQAAQSGLCSIAAGLESITGAGQKQSGAWRKLHFTSPDAFDLETMKKNILHIQGLGIEILGFFIVGWDEDTLETYQRTLDFCDEMRIIPFILTLAPMPGSQIYREYREKGRLIEGLSWEFYGNGAVVYRHPGMPAEEMFEANARVIREGYSLGRIAKRALRTLRHRPSLDLALSSFFTQVGLRKSLRAQSDRTREQLARVWGAGGGE
jgi:hypothetical protein